MARRNPKTEQILADAERRLNAASTALRAAEAERDRATAVFEEVADFYDELKRALAPTASQSTPEKPKKKFTSKSRRSPNSMAETIAKGLKERREESVTISPLDNPNACEYRFDGGKICGSDKDSGIHDKAMGYSGYHEFVGKSDASSAASQSSTNGAGSGSTRNSETEREDASSAHHVASGD